MSDLSSVPDQVELVDVSGQSLGRLMRNDDPELAARIDELVALLRKPREGTLAGWNSYLDSDRDSH
jgi:hypothetical protein